MSKFQGVSLVRELWRMDAPGVRRRPGSSRHDVESWKANPPLSETDLYSRKHLFNVSIDYICGEIGDSNRSAP
ncbi:MAG: hypothetical protein LBH44_05165 [Treponema sp.]|nr:hypothetical protein [Treponema sp.]